MEIDAARQAHLVLLVDLGLLLGFLGSLGDLGARPGLLVAKGLLEC